MTIDSTGVRVNGIVLKNSTPRLADEPGRPMPPYQLTDYTLGNDEVLLMASFENNHSIGNRTDSNLEIRRMEENQNENREPIEERIERKLREAEFPGAKWSSIQMKRNG